MTKDEFNEQIRQAMSAHAGWKAKLKRATSGGVLDLSAQDVRRDDLCTFGKWLKDVAEDADVGGTEAFETVCKRHSAFHVVAGEVAAKVEAGDAAAAKAVLDGADYKSASDELASALYAWKASAA